ncbi:MAG: hypothetical protein LBH77_04390 [Tannerella sp.]|jgi:hypothetical protein|nr:hypothetical protein [Tannerella sp.]
METNKQYKRKVSRKQFLQLCGSMIAGGSILAVSGVLFRNRFAAVLQGSVNAGGAGLRRDVFTSPYRLAASFGVPGHIEAFELVGEHIIVATANNIFVYDRRGSLLNNFAVGSNLRDIATDGENLYLLFPARVEVCDRNGEWLREWEACSELSDYCSLTVASGAVFVTDAANKHICKYTTGGDFVAFIQSPDGFVIPSYTFGITSVDGIIYCSNSGRHRVEKYTAEGEYIGSFGKAGGVAGMFCGCCNPVHLAHTSAGEIITSEKGNPRIGCYGADGKFRNILLDGKALGGGHTAYDIKVHGDKLFIAGKNLVSVFRYDKALAAETACSACGVDCPLRRGVTV